MRFHIQELFIDFQSDDETREYFTNVQTFGSSAVSIFQTFGKTLAIIITGVTHDVLCVAEHGFSQVLRMRNEHHNRLDMNKTGGNAIRLKFTKLQPASKINWQIKCHGKIRSSWNQLFLEWNSVFCTNAIAFVFSSFYMLTRLSVHFDSIQILSN